MSSLYAVLQDRTPDIVRRWEAFVDQAPWNQLSESDRLDDLPKFLDSLFNLAISAPPERRQPSRFLEAATSHGEQRRRCGLSYDHIMEESAFLRRAVYEHAKPYPQFFHEMVKVDSALTVGLMASLRGYAKPELEARGDWDTTLAQLASDWTALLRD
jgi:hypothetical protein